MEKSSALFCVLNGAFADLVPTSRYKTTQCVLLMWGKYAHLVDVLLLI